MPGRAWMIAAAGASMGGPITEPALPKGCLARPSIPAAGFGLLLATVSVAAGFTVRGRGEPLPQPNSSTNRLVGVAKEPQATGTAFHETVVATPPLHPRYGER